MQEEIEELFVSVRDLILSRPDGDVAEVKWLLDHLPSAQQQGGRRQQQHQDSIGQLIQVGQHPGLQVCMACQAATAFWR